MNTRYLRRHVGRLVDLINVEKSDDSTPQLLSAVLSPGSVDNERHYQSLRKAAGRVNGFVSPRL